MPDHPPRPSTCLQSIDVASVVQGGLYASERWYSCLPIMPDHLRIQSKEPRRRTVMHLEVMPHRSLGNNRLAAESA